jgi:hypothetical protein
VPKTASKRDQAITAELFHFRSQRDMKESSSFDQRKFRTPVRVKLMLSSRSRHHQPVIIIVVVFISIQLHHRETKFH